MRAIHATRAIAAPPVTASLRAEACAVRCDLSSGRPVPVAPAGASAPGQPRGLAPMRRRAPRGGQPNRSTGRDRSACTRRARARIAGTKPVGGPRVEPVLPPQAQDAQRAGGAVECAARCGRPAGRRTGWAARSSPSVACAPGCTPPRRSRSRTGCAAGRGPTRTGRVARGSVTSGCAARAGGWPHPACRASVTTM